MIARFLFHLFAFVLFAGEVSAQPASISVGGVSLIAVEPFEGGRVITGAPYTAEAVTEVRQTLPDGNRIENRTSASVARDSQGRVRREQRAMALGALVAHAPGPIATITDPVEGVFVTLDLERKVAMRSESLPGRPAKVGEPGGQRIVGRGVGMPLPVPPQPPPPPGEVSSESIGTAQIEGVQAEGTRTTLTIPAGEIGNQLPIAVVTERWFSPELQVLVSSKRLDPRTGETVYRLTNIVRGEPAPELFRIPADFHIEEPRPTKVRP